MSLESCAIKHYVLNRGYKSFPIQEQRWKSSSKKENIVKYVRGSFSFDRTQLVL